MKRKPFKGRKGLRGPSSKMRNSTIPKESTRTFFNGFEQLRSLNIFNLSHRARLRYHTEVDLGVQSATPTCYVFSANGLYDPDVTSTGHQPMGFDQMMAFFQHYCVTGSRITVTFMNNVSDNGAFTYAALTVQRSSSGLTVWDRILEAGDVVWTPLTALIQSGGPPPCVLRTGARVADFFTVPDVRNDDTLKGTASAQPAAQVYYAIYGVVVNAGSPSTGHLYASVTIEYDAVFTEPLQPIES